MMVLSSASGTVATSTTVPECPSVPDPPTVADVEPIHTPGWRAVEFHTLGRIIGLMLIDQGPCDPTRLNGVASGRPLE